MITSSPTTDGSESAEARLALAREALERYAASCFWFLRDDLVVTEATLPTIIKGLRSYGDREAFLIAARLCR
jgi:hypothetical protein